MNNVRNIAVTQVTSLDNIKVKEAVSLVHSPKDRKEKGAYVAEGIKMFLEAPKERILRVFVSEGFLGEAGDEVLEKLGGLECIETRENVFKKISDTQEPQGIVSIIKALDYGPDDLFVEENPLILALEDVRDPGNLGTMVRTAECAGASGILLIGNCADIYNPKTIRSTMGSIYRMPFLKMGDIKAAAKLLKDNGIYIYAAHLRGEALYDECPYDRGCAFLIGNESRGLSDGASSLADCKMKIPMRGKAESLNASIAAALLLYEAARQRRHRK